MRNILYYLLLFSTFATAQVTDDFSDGDFTANPVWNGDVTDFTIASGQLRSNSATASSNFYLSTPSATATNAEWEFYVNLQFNTSSANYTDIYLVSDSSNLRSASHSGYFVRIGNTSDDICLYKRITTTNSILIDGANGVTNHVNNILKIKVTRDISNLWTLNRDTTGTGTSYVTEGTVSDAAISTSNYFGIFIQQSTASFFNKHFYDSIYIGPIIVDINPPTIVSSTVISTNQVDILFSEPMDLITTQTLSNYNVNNGLGNPSAAVRDAVNFSIVHLTFSAPFTNGLLNTITVTNVQDLAANPITTTTTNFTYFVTVMPSYKDIIINEIMADPTPQVNVPAVEFIEVYNRSTNSFDLSGWKFTDGSSTATLGSYVLPSHQYLIICNTADTALFAPYGLNHIGVGSFPSLNNTGDHLYLKDNTLATIDSVIYSDSWYQDATKKLGGWTLELINPNANSNCPASSNWIASNDINGGTPGAQNSVYSTVADTLHPIISGVSVVDSTHIYVCFSEALDASVLGVTSNYFINGGIGNPSIDTVNSTLTCVYLTLTIPMFNSTSYKLTVNNMSDCSGNALLIDTANFAYYKVKPFDVVINEIMADPDPVLNVLPNEEYVELYNKTQFPINLNNWTFSAGTTTRTVTNAIIQPQSYIVLTNPAAVPFFFSNINIAGVTGFPGITNTGSTLILKSPEGAVISTVSYTDAWYQDSHKINGGWSLEQIDPNNPCAGMSNWRASTGAAGGTPGTINSIKAVNADHSPPQAVRVSVIATDTIQLYFNEPLDSVTMLNPAIYSINNSIGNPTLVRPVAPDFISVQLTLASALQPAIIYTISLNNALTDCAGNTIGLDNTARFALPENAAPNDIVINEILADPNVGGVDFVELYNRSNKVIDLKSLTLSQFDTIASIITSPKTITDNGFLMFPQDYLVLSTNGNAVKSQYNTTNPKGFLDLPSMITMNIDAGTVCLSSATDIIDNFTYYADMQYALLNVTKGVSLERIDFNRITQDRTNWHSAAQDIGFGTPGYKNSQYNDAGETENEIEIAPEIFSPDEDGFNDIVNINYHFDTPGCTANVNIYDSKGLLIKHLIRSELLGIKGTFSWDGINDDREKSRIGIYIIYFEVFDLAGAVKHYKKTCVLGGKL